ncbi:vanadium-dependent haloperoxidase [Ilyomonas limi]|uniref:Vanadium-dependent haloperoxidase n=1 Tax=Ilyomonas limi TaxID=2575867 RepID=A0A4U3L8G6_9BACT|nr:vanadium-dependent haloperoxidase [Ilyomonas limi]TKK70196.1 vanadium-dependent haloperoxidase [Ilyomonas limi]
MKQIFFFLSVIVLLSACKNNGEYKKVMHDPILFSQTVHELNGIVMGNNFSPVVATRNYTYASIAAYEVVAAGNSKYHSLADQLRGLNTLPQPTDAQQTDFPFAALLAYCKVGSAVTFPEGSMDAYVDALKQKAKDAGMPSKIFDNSVNYADAVADAVLDWSKKDNYAQTRSASKFTVTQEEGRWVPTPPMYAQAVEPHWMEIRPMVMDSASQFRVPPPLEFNMKDTNSEYCKQVMLIKNAIENLTPEQEEIANFWDDNPFKLNVNGHVMFGTKKFSPTGHWQSIIGIAAQKANADFDETVYAYTKTSIAMFDAFIQCWDAKYTYNTARPETVINKYIDPNWRPLLQTPAFPEYTCGHSTVSSAAAEALTSVFGDNFSYKDTTELEFGLTSRSYPSFRAAAIENNWARFYGGIHYHSSCITATEYGRKVGDFVANKLRMKEGEDRVAPAADTTHYY